MAHQPSFHPFARTACISTRPRFVGKDALAASIFVWRSVSADVGIENRM
jgi:hypothetical protein